MSINLKITAEEFETVGQINRISFNNYITSHLVEKFKSFDECCSVFISLPKTVTKMQRYNIHKLTLRNTFVPVSFDNQEDDRMMTITLSKEYVQDLFRDYPFFEQQPEPKTERQVLFDTLVQYINENLENEFQEYLNAF